MRLFASLLLTFPLLLPAQDTTLAVTGGVACFYRGTVVCGLDSSGSALRVFRIDSLGRATATNELKVPSRFGYLPASADTLHGFLNVYLHHRAGNAATIVRLNADLSAEALVENVPVSRINNTSLFTNETFIHERTVFTAFSRPDSAGAQYYLNRYDLVDTKANFDYKLTWQYAFERKHIGHAHIFYADKRRVQVFVRVLEGPARGEWMIVLESSTGRFLHGTRVSTGDAPFLFGSCKVDKRTGDTWLAGQVADTAAPMKKTVKLFAVKIDSSGERRARIFCTAPVNDKTHGSVYLARIHGPLSLEGPTPVTLLKRVDSCYYECGSSALRLAEKEERPVAALAPFEVLPAAAGEVAKNSQDGRLCPAADLFSSLYTAPILPRILITKGTGTERKWMLLKSDNRLRIRTLLFVNEGKPKPEITLSKPIDQRPQVIFVSSTRYLAAFNDGTAFHLSAGKW